MLKRFRNKPENKLLSKTDAYAGHVNIPWILDAFPLEVLKVPFSPLR